jgi:very-short-patch-repair endonuclease
LAGAAKAEFCRLKFRRQHAIDGYIVDFYCAAVRLVVEVDGPVNDTQREADSERQKHLKSLGLRVLRFTNEQVLSDLSNVVALIEKAIQPEQDQ